MVPNAKTPNSINSRVFGFSSHQNKLNLPRIYHKFTSFFKREREHENVWIFNPDVCYFMKEYIKVIPQKRPVFHQPFHSLFDFDLKCDCLPTGCLICCITGRHNLHLDLIGTLLQFLLNCNFTGRSVNRNLLFA